MNLNRFVTLLFLMAAGVIASGQLYVNIPIIAAICDRFSVTPANALWMNSSFGLAYAVGFLFWGPTSDKFGRKKMLLVGIMLSFVSTVFAAFVSNYGVELICRIAFGLSAAVVPPVGLALISEMFTERWRPIAQGMMSFSFIASAPILQFYSSEAVGAGWSIPKLISWEAFCLLLTVIGIAIFAPNLHHKNNAVIERYKKPSLKESFRLLSGDPVIVTVWVVSFTALTGFVTFQTQLNGSIDHMGWDQFAIRMFTLIGMLTCFVVGIFIRRFSDIKVLRSGLSISCIALLFCIFSPLPLPIEIVALSMGIALSVPGIISIISRRASDADRGLGIAVYSFCLFLGASLSPIFAHVTASSVSLTMLLPVIFLSSALIFLCMPWMKIRSIHHGGIK